MIAHVDMDAFYVSVELLRRPELRGKPVLVATGTNPTARGVVMAASYEARRFGVHSALPLTVAHRRCPDAVLVPRDMQLYKRASNAVMEVLRGYSDRIEIAGLDEAYLDLSSSPVPETRARELKREVLERTRLVCSVGLAPNKLLAKIASDLDKPDGFRVLHREEMIAAVGDRPASLIPGVGPRTVERLQSMGIRTVADLAGALPARLEQELGPKLGRALSDRARGLDERPVEPVRMPKSESRETTFSTDVAERAVMLETVERLANEVCEHLDADGYAGRTVTLKIRLQPFETHTRSRTLDHPTRDPATIVGTARQLLERFNPARPVRLLGVGVAGLEADGTAETEDRPPSPPSALTIEGLEAA